MQRTRKVMILLVMVPAGFILMTCAVAAFALQYPIWYFEDAQCVFATNVYAQEIATPAGDYVMEFGLMFYRDQEPDSTWRHPDGWWCTRR